MCRKAIRDPAPFGEWSREMRISVGEDSRRITLHFITTDRRVSPGRIEPIMEAIVYVLLIITSLVGRTFIVERGLALRWKKSCRRRSRRRWMPANRATTPERSSAFESTSRRSDDFWCCKRWNA